MRPAATGSGALGAAAAKVEQCVICFENAADHLIVPCGHLCGCGRCLASNKVSNCPICRVPVQSVVKVFHAGIIEEQQQSEGGARTDEGGDGGWATHDDDSKRAAAAAAGQQLSSPNELRIAVSKCGGSNAETKEETFACIISLADGTDRVPLDCCCVIDISGSMGDLALFQDPEHEGKVVSQGFSILDVVKHAVKAIVGMLTEVDRLSIVAFDSVAFTAFPLSYLTESGKDKAISALSRLMPRDSTNIFAGLEAGLDSLRYAKDAAMTVVPRKRVCLLLTDGFPMESPPDGEVAELQRYFDKNGRVAQISTFGFGYQLNSALLASLSKAGRGQFSFIPDAKLIGTCFINFIANAASTISQSAKLFLVPKEGTTLAKVCGGVEYTKNSYGVTVSLGNLQYGQQRSVVFTATVGDRDDFLAVVLEVEGDKDGDPVKTRFQANLSDASETADSIVAFQRALLVDAINATIQCCSQGRGQEGVASLKSTAAKFAGFAAASSDSRAKVLAADLQGRCVKAVSTLERWNRWGQHYLRAIVLAHTMQICTNNLDVGLQQYGHTLFKSLVTMGASIFVNMPMERAATYASPSWGASNAPNAGNVPANAAGNAAAPAAAAAAAVYYDGGGGGGGCFGAECTVERADGSAAPLRALGRGEWVRVASGAARVACVVAVRQARARLVRLPGGLAVSPRHPVWCGGAWRRPADLVGQWLDGARVELAPPAPATLYNLVLEGPDRRLLVSGVVCTTLGHGICDEGAYHPFYATEAVIEVVKRQPGYDQGLVYFDETLKNSPTATTCDMAIK